MRDHPIIEQMERNGYLDSYFEPETCDICGEEFEDDWYYDIDGEHICDDCLCKMYRKHIS